MWKAFATLIVVMGSIVALGVAADGDAQPRQPIVTMPDEHVQQHADMTEQMRSMTAGATAPHMAGSSMWQMMRDPAHIRAEEQYHRDLDRMLARPSR